MLVLRLQILARPLAVCRLNNGEPIPSWATEGDFFSVTRTDDELSIVCDQMLVPTEIRAEHGWRVLRIAGKFEFTVVGVLASLVRPLAESGIPVFAISTFDTDYLLVKDHDLARSIDALKNSGHRIEPSEEHGSVL